MAKRNYLLSNCSILPASLARPVPRRADPFHFEAFQFGPSQLVIRRPVTALSRRLPAIRWRAHHARSFLDHSMDEQRSKNPVHRSLRISQQVMDLAGADRPLAPFDQFQNRKSLAQYRDDVRSRSVPGDLFVCSSRRKFTDTLSAKKRLSLFE
ncbi:hypothetical protein ACP_0772 [Acidobacterium capsulatum ATCC 51196]|uniref:Uncharacterized protein n=1 Tax=Acidobacterium capsulatum (strain ATCC 51196 / DSM 11244 / BCRC 80197 / JCM 7670 / NBRC 15755 / NCIMB 13165 / 161) TaxID=240015 RepID=C1F2B0_ACIC5|nr:MULTISPECIES: hypothetical protein [Acidobacterium]ACO33784.1 hypothetical protein ACP_0772 [Acidobacterium capsulatum ATCC 51196]